MARRKRKAKEQGTAYVWEIGAPETFWKADHWLVDGTIMKVNMVEEAPEEFQDFHIPVVTERNTVEQERKNRRALWREIRERLTAAGTPTKIYEYANMHNVWGEALKYIDVLDQKGEPVAWFDLDGGLVQYTTLWDLMFVGPMLVPKEGEAKGRKLFMMTESQWENREYPPEVGTRTTSARPSGRLASEDDHGKQRADGIRRRAARTRKR